MPSPEKQNGPPSPQRPAADLPSPTARTNQVGHQSTRIVPAPRQSIGHPGEQLSLPGMTEAVAADDSVWVDDALAALEALAAEGIEFTADALRKRVGVPVERNRIGALFLVAQARGEIVPVGVTRSSSRARHAGKLLVWLGAA